MAKKKEENKTLMRGELPDHELELLKTQYPKLKTLIFCNGDILDEGEKAVVYVKNFSRPLYEAILDLQEKKANKLTQAEWMLKNLRVAGMETKDILDDIDWLKNFAYIAQGLTYVHYGDIKKN